MATQRLVVIGGDAAGMAAASEARRQRPNLDIVALERGRWTSYSACGIPYLVAGEVHDLDQLVVRSPQVFRDQHHIDARVGQEAVAVDLDAGKVDVRDHNHRRNYRLGFDQVLFATGAMPRRPDLPGIDGAHVYGVQTLHDGVTLLDRARAGGVQTVVVVGGGYIGLEMAEAFSQRGCDVTVVEQGSEVMPALDPDMGALVSRSMRAIGIEVRCGEVVEAIEETDVITGSGAVPADLVVLGMGVRPNSALAQEAGVLTGDAEGIVVDVRQRTEAPHAWAAGDCCESFHLVSRRSVHVALGTVANKQGRVAGVNIGGGYATFPGVLGTAATRLCATEIARTGLTEAQASDAGLEAVTATVESTARAGYMPEPGSMVVKVVAERRSGRLLGAQIVGGEGAAKRIDVFATALTATMTVEDMVALDLSYHPAFGPVWDPVLIAARKAWAAVERGESTN
ncbi:MAG: FAD-dependent oxidoreductase [Actinomycetota bacterium]|nr:FAD-dependent oxidoreductase [Actinomycetota bacterium]